MRSQMKPGDRAIADYAPSIAPGTRSDPASEGSEPPCEPETSSPAAASSDTRIPQRVVGGVVGQVDADSPADRAGIVEGSVITHVDGKPITDILEWSWLTEGCSVRVEGLMPAMDASPSKTGSEAGRHPRRFERRLRRKPTESWGIEFTDTVFDRMILCHNDCVFCFMKMLPKGMRNTLYLRDDDYRLSFLQGNFVTLTNMGEQDVRRIIEEGLSPLHVSVHAITPSVRESIMGKNAAHGIEVLERLLDAGIEAHAQIVLMPGENDGDELDRTLSWLEQRPGIISCGIVPLGYTRFQTRFDHSFNDPAAAAAVIDQVEPYRVRSREATGLSRFFLADEFYLNAGRPMPPSDTYDGFEQYEDGIGMIRSFEDEWDGLEEEGAFLPFEEPSCAPAPADATRMVCGVAFARWFDGLLLTSPLAPHLKVLGVENDYFGGNVDVTGLLCGCDVLKALAGEREAAGSDFPVILPRAMFNADRITLDGMTADDLSAASGLPITVVSCNAEDIVTTLMRRIAGGGSRTEGMV